MQQSSKQAQSMFINTNNLIDNEENDEEDKKVENIRQSEYGSIIKKSLLRTTKLDNNLKLDYKRDQLSIK